MERIPEGWDGNNYHISPSTSTTFRVAAAHIEETEVSSDSSNDEAAPTIDKLTRQERKALGREIPWRVIANGPDDIMQLYVEANVKEFNSWLSWGCIQKMSPEEIQKVKSTPAQEDHPLQECLP